MDSDRYGVLKSQYPFISIHASHFPGVLYRGVPIARALRRSNREAPRRKSMQASWNVVCQLLLQMAPNKREGLEDRLIKALCDTLPGLGPDEREVALSVCVESLGGVPLRPDSVEIIAVKALDQYVARLSRAPADGPNSYPSVEDSRSYWLQSSRIAVENLRVASEVLRHRLNSFITSRPRGHSSSEVAKGAAHMFDFASSEGSDLRLLGRWWFLDDSKERIREALRTTRAGWLQNVALLSGVPFDSPLQVPALALGEDVPFKVSSVRVPWGCRPVPSLLEVVVWWAINGSANEIRLMDGTLERCARAVLGGPTRRLLLRFDPHWSWFESSYACLPATDSGDAEMSDEVLSWYVRCALALSELFMNAEGEERVTRAKEIRDKEWGRLDIVSSAIALRYGFSTDVSLEDLERIRLLKIEDWCNGAEYFGIRTVDVET